MVMRNTTQRDRDRNAIRRTKPPCGICEQPIDYSLPYLDPGEFVVDHVIPLNKGGEDALPNKQAAHRHPSLQSAQERQDSRGLCATNVRHGAFLVERSSPARLASPGPWTT